jgi:hypothetical protein
MQHTLAHARTRTQHFSPLPETMFKLLAVIALSGAANAQWCSDCESIPVNTSCCYLRNSHPCPPPSRVFPCTHTPHQRMLQCRIVLSTVEWEWTGCPHPHSCSCGVRPAHACMANCAQRPICHTCSDCDELMIRRWLRCCWPRSRYAPM